MPDLKNTHADILDTLYLKHVEGKLAWKPREGEQSFETSAGNFVFHIDRKINLPEVNYRIWVFSKSGEALDNFDPKELKDFKPESDRFDTFTKLASGLYREIKESFTLKQIVPALNDLKSA